VKDINEAIFNTSLRLLITESLTDVIGFQGDIDTYIIVRDKKIVRVFNSTDLYKL